MGWVSLGLENEGNRLDFGFENVEIFGRKSEKS